MMLKLTSLYTSSFLKVQFILMYILIAAGCANNHQPVERLQEKQDKRKQLIEEKLANRYGENIYQSLAYGPLTVYKPESFRALDSLYALKDDFIDRNDLRGLRNSGVEEKIPAYRAEAQNNIDKVRYEIEHIYRVKKEDSIRIVHTFFTYDYNDSLLSEDEIYDYKFPDQYEEMHTNYLFEYHFTTNRNLYISSDERDFIRYFKQYEQQLAGSDKLDSFMVNTLKTMKLARKINSVDYRELIKYRSIENLKSLGKNITINEFGTLVALKNNDNQIVGYDYEIRWQDNEDKIKKKSIFMYSPTLTLEDITTKKE